MADSFADLWNSTTPSKPAEPPRKLGAASPTTTLARPQNDLFSLLAPAPLSTNSRSITPAATGSLQATRVPAGGSPALAPAPAKVQKSTPGGDAFGDLLSGTFASTNAGGSYGASMTMAERAAKAERERMERLQGKTTLGKQGVDTAWAGLDSLGASSFSATSSSHSQEAQPADDDWAFASAPSRSNKASKPAEDDWGLDDFVSSPAPAKATSSSKQAQSLLDLDEFTSAPPTRRTRPEPARPDSPGDDFDFGTREDALLNNLSDDEDDILGDLAKPVDARPARSTRPSPPPQPSRAPSPPPHILGQIVEMGFSPEQARVALAATDSGLDVQAALETLLASTAGADPSSPPPRERRPETRRPPRERYADSDEEPEAPRDRRPPPRAARDAPPRDGPSPGAQANLQEQADRLLAQASELGLSMFNRANVFWKESREKVQRAYEERAAAAAAASNSNSAPRAGEKPRAEKVRPKWMQEVPEHVRDEEGWKAQGGFEDEPEVLPPGPSRQARPPQAKQRVQDASATPSASSSVKTGDLLADEVPTVYRSPFRRKTPAQPPASTPAPAPARAPLPIPLKQRKTVPASAAALATSAKHKATGTEMFKLGRYAEAEAAYTAAIAALPTAHLLLVPLHNNRALTRLKTGEHRGAVEDCTAVLGLLGADFHPAREAPVTAAEEGAGVDLADAHAKALRRRAEAYEGSEKWELARKDWEALAAAEWAGKARADAVRGAGRCRRMLSADAGGGAEKPARPAAPPKPRPQPAQRRPTPPSEALDRVRAANQAAEAEDQRKHELKDVVDTRLAAWKGGKETNIRALIASLDTVLWPELGWQKVGLHELVTPAQVKIRYTKAIAKLHPDKLNVNNTTLEQRMIANGVFGSLNDAWNAFKQ